MKAVGGDAAMTGADGTEIGRLRFLGGNSIAVIAEAECIALEFTRGGLSARVRMQARHGATVARWMLDACERVANDPAKPQAQDHPPVRPREGGDPAQDLMLDSRLRGNERKVAP